MYLKWSPEIVLNIFKHDDLAFIQTNSRSMPESDAVRMNREITNLICEASKKTSRDFSIISRSDSSLRGHYPAELYAIKEEMEFKTAHKLDAVFMIPFFAEGRRFTFRDIHYIQQGEDLIPVNLTEFAKDSNFHFLHADLKEYIQEKSKGEIKASEVLSLSYRGTS